MKKGEQQHLEPAQMKFLRHFTWNKKIR
jgi:hypothetical protein